MCTERGFMYSHTLNQFFVWVNFTTASLTAKTKFKSLSTHGAGGWGHGRLDTLLEAWGEWMRMYGGWGWRLIYGRGRVTIW